MAIWPADGTYSTWSYWSVDYSSNTTANFIQAPRSIGESLTRKQVQQANLQTLRREEVMKRGRKRARSAVL